MILVFGYLVCIPIAFTILIMVEIKSKGFITLSDLVFAIGMSFIFPITLCIATSVILEENGNKIMMDFRKKDENI